ncbi:MAG: hypothetical protein KDA65_13750 [Planctomycetaceae bacterium]|nr:hypothetical protein [Planctomycetaceae bacterium]
MTSLHENPKRTLLNRAHITFWLMAGMVLTLSGCVSMFSRPAVTQNQAYPNSGVPNSQFYSAPQSTPAQQVPRQSYYPPRSILPQGSFFRGGAPSQYAPPVNPRNQVPRVGEPVSPSAPAIRSQPPQPTTVPPLTPGILERPRTYKKPTTSPPNTEVLPPAPQSNDTGQTSRKTAPALKPDPVLGMPSEEIVIGEQDSGPPADDFEFLLKKQSEEELDQLDETEAPSELRQQQEQEEPVQESDPFGELVDPPEAEVESDGTFEAPLEEELPPASSNGDSSGLTLPPIKEPAPADKLFEETIVPPLSEVELLTAPSLEPLTEDDLDPVNESVETLKVSPPADSSEPNSTIGPLLEFNSSTLRDELKLKVVAQEKTQVGSGTLFEIYITNQSTEVFRDLTLKAAFNQALFVPNREGDELTRFIPRIDPGEEQKIPLTLFSEQTGYHCVRFSLSNASREELSWKSACVTYIPEAVRSDIIGPEVVSVDSSALFTVVVQNLSENTLENLTVDLRYDPVLQYLGSTTSVEQRDQELCIPIPKLQPAERVAIPLSFRGMKASENSSLTLKTYSDKLPSTETGHYLTIQHPQGALDLDVDQKQESLQTGDETELIVICRNRGLETLKGSQLAIQIPAHLQLIQSGWGAQRTTVDAENLESGQGLLQLSVPEIPPGISARYAMHVKALRPGKGPIEFRYLNSSTTPAELNRSLPVVILK